MWQLNVGPTEGKLRYDLPGDPRHKYRFFYTFSAHSDSLTPCFLCLLTRLLRTERGPPIRHSLVPAVLSLSLLLSTLVAAQGASYTFTTINVPGSTDTVAYGISETGQIVGWFFDAITTEGRGFLKDGTTFTNMARTSFTLVGNSADSPEPLLYNTPRNSDQQLRW